MKNSSILPDSVTLSDTSSRSLTEDESSGSTNKFRVIPNAEKENVEISPKIDAFQFMMNSRHKSIGRNSPGRELELNESTDSIFNKKKLNDRRKKFESWAEKKGASKRKREYEEVGNIINYKLQRREKKMKEMLKINCYSDDELVIKKKKCAVIESDSDNSNGALTEMVQEEENETLKKKKKKRRNRSSGELKLTSRNIKSWKFKIKLSMNGSNDNEQTGGSTNEVGENSEKDIPTTANEHQPQRYGALQNEKDFENGTVPSQLSENETASDQMSENSLVILNDSQNEMDETSDSLNKSKRVLRPRRPTPKIYDLSDEEEDKEEKKKRNKYDRKKLKVAPVFLKSVPKPKLDPKIAEARRQFLLSGIPPLLKKEMERQQSAEEIEFNTFPTVSHVRQKSPNHSFWDLPEVDLKIHPQESVNIEIKNFSKDLLDLKVEQPREDLVLPSQLKNVIKFIKEIKSQNPGYPVYKIFNSIRTKSGYRTEKVEELVEKPKSRGRPKKKPIVKSRPVSPTKTNENIQHAMWTEKYKPTFSHDIIGNHTAISSLKDWLSSWLDISRRHKDYDSESDFDIDSDSRDSTKTCGNTVIVKGPTGSGKTAAVYALCNEMGLDVIEVNASSKRTGKRLLQELQEATRSHQVRKKDDRLSSFVTKEKKAETPKPKMCLLLVEDVDIVFEQDEGFVFALSQIMSTSKRPIILTTTDEPPLTISRLINDRHLIKFSPLSSILTIWLQIVCLVEGYYVKSHSIEEVLTFHKGDVRRTLMQLQLFVTSGGQPCKNENEIQNVTKIESDTDLKMDDDSSNLSDLRIGDATDSQSQIHENCLQVGRVVRDFGSFTLPDSNNLGIIWWNLPLLLNLPNFANVRLNKNSKIDGENDKRGDKKQLNLLSNCFDSLVFCDVVCGGSQYHESLERRWRFRAKDSLSLEENLDGFLDSRLSSDLAQDLLSRTIKVYRDNYGVKSCSLNMAVPSDNERRWRSKQLSTDEKLQEAVTFSNFLDRKSLVLDYVPYLRTIARNDRQRATNNTKRGNRYYSHLKSLGIRCNESTLKVACDVFKEYGD